MQDRDGHNNFDEAFTDYAWSAMSEVLDREMPVKKKRSRFTFWWCLGGILLLLGSGYFYLSTHSLPAVLPQEELPLAQGVPEGLEANQFMVQEEAKGGEEQLKIQDWTATSEQPVAVIAKDQVEGEGISQGNTMNLSGAKSVESAPVMRPRDKIAAKATATPIRQLANAANASISKSSSSSVRTMTTSSLATTAQERVPLELAELAVLDMATLTVPRASQEDKTWQKELPKVSSSIFSFAGSKVYAGLQSSNFAGLLGMRTGIDAIWKLNGRWELSLGLGFQRLRNEHDLLVATVSGDDITLIGEKLVSRDRGDLNSGQAAIFSAERSNRHVALRVDHFDFLQLPIQFYYQHQPNLRFHMGLQISYLLNAKGNHLYYRRSNDLDTNESTVGSGGGNNSGVTSDPSEVLLNKIAALDGAAILEHDLAHKLAFYRLNLGASVGVSYAFTRNIGIDLRYDFGVFNYKRNDFFGDAMYNRGLSLSLEYRFNQ